MYYKMFNVLGSFSILATACNLLQTQSIVEDPQRHTRLVEDWDGLETFSVGMRNMPHAPPPYTPQPSVIRLGFHQTQFLQRDLKNYFLNSYKLGFEVYLQKRLPVFRALLRSSVNFIYAAKSKRRLHLGFFIEWFSTNAFNPLRGDQFKYCPRSVLSWIDGFTRHYFVWSHITGCFFVKSIFMSDFLHHSWEPARNDFTAKLDVFTCYQQKKITLIHFNFIPQGLHFQANRRKLKYHQERMQNVQHAGHQCGRRNYWWSTFLAIQPNKTFNCHTVDTAMATPT